MATVYTITLECHVLLSLLGSMRLALASCTAAASSVSYVAIVHLLFSRPDQLSFEFESADGRRHLRTAPIWSTAAQPSWGQLRHQRELYTSEARLSFWIDPQRKSPPRPRPSARGRPAPAKHMAAAASPSRSAAAAPFRRHDVAAAVKTACCSHICCLCCAGGSMAACCRAPQCILRPAIPRNAAHAGNVSYHCVNCTLAHF